MVFKNVVKVGNTLWNHKKKSAAGAVALFFFGRYMYGLKRYLSKKPHKNDFFIFIHCQST